MEIWITRAPNIETQKLQQLLRVALDNLRDNGWRTKEYQETLEQLADWAAGEYHQYEYKQSVIESFRGYRCSMCRKSNALCDIETPYPTCKMCHEPVRIA